MGRGLHHLRRTAAAALLAAGVTLAALGGLAGPAAANGPFAWTGSGGTENWSNASNWNPAAAVTNATSLSFPALSPSCGLVCYVSNNDVSGLSVGGISIDDSEPYDITGDPVALGAGGLTASWGGHTSDEPIFALPITLSSTQSWAINGTMELNGAVTGSQDGLTIDFKRNSNPNSDGSSGLYLGGAGLGSGGLEVGPIEVEGVEGDLVIESSTNLNATDGNGVDIAGGAVLELYGSAHFGPLSTSPDGEVLIIDRDGPPSVLSVNGAASLHGRFEAGIAGPHSSSQLLATGNVSIAGPLSLSQEPASGDSCPDANFPVGSVYTLISAGGALSGRFEGTPNGATRGLYPDSCHRGPGPITLARINYTPHSVTATIIAAPSPAQIHAWLERVLKPTGRKAAIGRLLKHGGDEFRLAPPIGGVLTLSWSARSGHASRTVARGTLLLAGVGNSSFKLTLTTAGRKLLKHATRLRVHATASFHAIGQGRVHASKSFTLKR
jgi:hypothetical protein